MVTLGHSLVTPGHCGLQTRHRVSTSSVYRRVARRVRLPWKLLGSLLAFFVSVVVVTTRNMETQTPTHDTWNKVI